MLNWGFGKIIRAVLKKYIYNHQAYKGVSGTPPPTSSILSYVHIWERNSYYATSTLPYTYRTGQLTACG